MKKLCVITTTSLTLIVIGFSVSFSLQGKDSRFELENLNMDQISDEQIAILFRDGGGQVQQMTITGDIFESVNQDVFVRGGYNYSGVFSHYSDEYIRYQETGLGYQSELILVNGKTQDTMLLDSYQNHYENPYSKRMYPVDWISPDEVLVTVGGVESFFDDFGLYNVRTKQYRSLHLDFVYGGPPQVSPNGKWALAESNSAGVYDAVHGVTDQTVLINLITGEEKVILSNEETVLGWVMIGKTNTNKNSMEVGFLNCLNGHCLLDNTDPFFFPFECGHTYAVSRDGENCLPEDCGLSAGTPAFISWHSYTGAHDRPAIDFSDNQLASMNASQVIAAQTGVVDFAGWQDPNNSSVGFGLYVRLRHQRLDGSLYYTYYGHLSVLNVAVGQEVSQGDVLGLEGSTGSSTGEHIHFELRSAPGFGTSYWPQFVEIGDGTLPQQGYVYTSQNSNSGNCLSCCGLIDMNSATNGNCGEVITGMYDGSVVGLVHTYMSKPFVANGPATWNISGPEYVYKVAVEPGAFTASLTHESGDLDVFVLRGDEGELFLDPVTDCVGYSCGYICSGTLGTHTVEVNETENQEGGMYYIVVDGYVGINSVYSLIVDCIDQEITICNGDISGDGQINTADLLLFLSGFGCSPPQICFDLNFDGFTNTADLLLFLSVFGDVCN